MLLVAAWVLAAPLKLTVAWAVTEYVPVADFGLSLKLQVAVPVEPVVAVCLTVLPMGVVMVNVTLAPDAAVPPLSTVLVMGTVLLRV